MAEEKRDSNSEENQEDQPREEPSSEEKNETSPSDSSPSEDSGENKKDSQEDKEKEKEKKDEEEDEVGWVSENIEAIIIAIILALTLRHYAMEAFVIPTGSMAPTLLGIHMDMKCPNCDYEYEATKPSEVPPPGKEMTDSFLCPNCKFTYRAKVTRGKLEGGHRILVDKFAYKWRNPTRWEVIVFKSPELHHRNFIKRLIGLPGETIELVGGDLYIKDDEGKWNLERKPDWAQKALWMHEYSSHYKEKKANRLVWDSPEIPKGYAKKVHDTTTNRTIQIDKRFKIEPRQITGDFREGGPGMLRYYRGYQLGIRDIYGYNYEHYRSNGNNESNGNLVGDVRLVFQAKVEGDKSVLGAEICEGRRVFTLQVDLAKGVATLTDALPRPTGGVEPPKKVKEEKISIDGSSFHKYELANVDDQVVFRIDDQVVFRYLYRSPHRVPNSNTEHYWIHFTVDKGQLEMKDIRIDRDIYYTESIQRYAVDSALTLKNNEYFALGDNSPNSQDSRQWGTIPAKNMLGRAFMVFWPAWPVIYDWEAKFIR